MIAANLGLSLKNTTKQVAGRPRPRKPSHVAPSVSTRLRIALLSVTAFTNSATNASASGLLCRGVALCARPRFARRCTTFAPTQSTLCACLAIRVLVQWVCGSLPFSQRFLCLRMSHNTGAHSLIQRQYFEITCTVITCATHAIRCASYNSGALVSTQ